MDVPTLDAKLTLIYGIGLGGNGGDCLTVQYLQIEPTATATVGTGGQNSFIVHKNTPQIFFHAQIAAGGSTILWRGDCSVCSIPDLNWKRVSTMSLTFL